MESKLCSKCNTNHPASKEYFGVRTRRNKNGTTITLNSWCRKCTNHSSNNYNKNHNSTELLQAKTGFIPFVHPICKSGTLQRGRYHI
jgi:hypothetical protein